MVVGVPAGTAAAGMPGASAPRSRNRPSPLSTRRIVAPSQGPALIIGCGHAVTAAYGSGASRRSAGLLDVTSSDAGMPRGVPLSGCRASVARTDARVPDDHLEESAPGAEDSTLGAVPAGAVGLVMVGAGDHDATTASGT